MAYRDDAKRNIEIASRYRPVGVRVKFKRVGSRLGPAHSKIHKDGTKEIHSPVPTDRDGLFFFLHECAHLILRHWHVKLPVWRQEYEAEQWAIATFRREGIPVSKEMIKEAKRYVKATIIAHLKKGRPRPPLKVLRWCDILPEEIDKLIKKKL